WKLVRFTPEASEALRQYSWPGNIRELRNAIERLILLSNGEEVDGQTVRSVLSPTSATGTDLGSGPLASRLESFEREVIVVEVKRAGFHMTNAAKALGLERSHLYKKAEQLGIDIQKARREEEG